MSTKVPDSSPLSLFILDRVLPGVNRKYLPVIIITAIVIVSTFIRLIFVPSIPGKIQVVMVFTQFSFMFILWEYNKRLNALFDSFWAYNRKTILRFISQLFVSFIGYALFRTFVFYLFIDYVPVSAPTTFKVATYVIDFFVAASINIGFLAYYLLNQWRDSWMYVQQLSKEKTQVQYDNLKNQLNPHFLFNSLTSLNSLIHKDQELASRFLQQLSKVYRYLLENRLKETVSLKKELEFVAHYLELLTTRFGHAFQFSVNVSPEFMDSEIVPVSLQIMIENAIKHNLLSLEAPLKVEILVEENYLLIKNNLQLKEQVDTSNKVGLVNFAHLYSFLSDRKVSWQTEGNFFVVKIPLLNYGG